MTVPSSSPYNSCKYISGQKCFYLKKKYDCAFEEVNQWMINQNLDHLKELNGLKTLEEEAKSCAFSLQKS